MTRADESCTDYGGISIGYRLLEKSLNSAHHWWVGYFTQSSYCIWAINQVTFCVNILCEWRCDHHDIVSNVSQFFDSQVYDLAQSDLRLEFFTSWHWNSFVIEKNSSVASCGATLMFLLSSRQIFARMTLHLRGLSGDSLKAFASWNTVVLSRFANTSRLSSLSNLPILNFFITLRGKVKVK